MVNSLRHNPTIKTKAKALMKEAMLMDYFRGLSNR